MTSAELTEWVAFERVYGPILPHERIDIGFAQLGWLLTRLLGKSRRDLKVQEFLPAWYEELLKPSHDPDSIRRGFETLMGMAENADD